MNFQYWSGPNTSAPIFVFFGAEENIDDDVSAIGFLTDNASHFKALLLYIEYPHIASGALASSAPILYFDDTVPQVGFYSIVSKDFKETSESCYKTISESWAEIEKVASNPDGLSILSKKFKTCTPLKRSSQLKDYLDSMYIEAAQFDHPPSHLVSIVCDGIDGAPQGSDVLGRIFGGVVAYQGEYSCYDINYYNNLNDQSSLAWIWQDLKLMLHRFASNIIFSNGLRDPYSSGGVLENISDSIVAVSTINGSLSLSLKIPNKEIVD
ncbi:hypothetical protein JCGZ_05401 [Jatropha curcas]|uniref:Uncharacterized protein n=1 Tax=Jatropha curcas TaxID=180498 RepID=A0A067LI76_JATCU|nr:hypothetical protein JCGZ_05401 [Jatropha curcas]